MARARKIERFLSQPFFVAEVFTGSPGKLVDLADTIKGFKGLVEGKYDHLPEAAFYMVGTIEEAVEKAQKLAAEAACMRRSLPVRTRLAGAAPVLRRGRAVIVPGTEGDFAVLKDHAPLMTPLRPGVVEVDETATQKSRLFVRGGFADVAPRGLTILAEPAMPVEEFDADAIAAEIKNAEEDVADAKRRAEAARQGEARPAARAERSAGDLSHFPDARRAIRGPAIAGCSEPGKPRASGKVGYLSLAATQFALPINRETSHGRRLHQ